MKKEKVILFGGTFDPVHNGHTGVAVFAANTLGASKVIFIPARRSPHKRQKPMAMDNDRLNMLKLIAAENPLFDVSASELNRGEPSYSIDTVFDLQKKFQQNTEFYWLLGADMLGDLPKWHRIEELLGMVNLCLMNRGGYLQPDFGLLKGKIADTFIDKLKKYQLSTPSIDISSTKIRQNLASEQDVSDMVSIAVLNYIKKHSLYSLSHQLSRSEDI